MGALARMIKDSIRADYEAKHGRIVSWPNLVVWAGKFSSMKEYYPVERNGRMTVLVEKEAVRCPNPEMWSEDEWYFERKPQWKDGEAVVWIPLAMCRKCEHYMKSDKSGKQRWPRCRLSRMKNQDKTFDTMGDIVAAAAATAKKIIDGEG